MPNQVTDARVRRVSFVDRAATRDPNRPTEPRRKLLWKSEDAPNDPAEPEKGGGTMPATVEDLQADLEKAEKERDEALAKAEQAEEKADELEKRAIGRKGAKPADGDGPDDGDEKDADDLSKADLTPAVRAILEKRDTELVELRKRAESAEEIAKGERDARVEAEFVEMAKSELPELGDPEIVGKRLKKFSETLEKAEYDEYLREQTAVNEQLSKAAAGAFGEVGRSGQPPRSSQGLPEIMAKAEELAKADPSLSSAEAFRRAAKDPSVQAQYARERDATRAA